MQNAYHMVTMATPHSCQRQNLGDYLEHYYSEGYTICPVRPYGKPEFNQLLRYIAEIKYGSSRIYRLIIISVCQIEFMWSTFKIFCNTPLSSKKWTFSKIVTLLHTMAFCQKSTWLRPYLKFIFKNYMQFAFKWDQKRNIWYRITWLPGNWKSACVIESGNFASKTVLGIG